MLVSYLRTYIRRLRRCRSLAKVHRGARAKADNVIITPYPECWDEAGTKDKVLGDVFRFCRENGKQPRYCPVLFDYNALPTFKMNSAFDAGYFNFFPSRLQVARLMFDFVDCYAKIKKEKFELASFTFVDNVALKFELLDVLHHRLEYFCNHLWLKNYFSDREASCNVFF